MSVTRVSICNYLHQPNHKFNLTPNDNSLCTLLNCHLSGPCAKFNNVVPPCQNIEIGSQASLEIKPPSDSQQACVSSFCTIPLDLLSQGNMNYLLQMPRTSRARRYPFAIQAVEVYKGWQYTLCCSDMRRFHSKCLRLAKCSSAS